MSLLSKKKSSQLKVLMVLALVVSLSLGAYLFTAKDIILTIDGVEEEIVSYASTVEEFLEVEEIDLEEGTYVNVPLDIELEDYMNIVIKTPKAYIITIGHEQDKVYSVHTNVEDILRDLNIKLVGDDYTYPELHVDLKVGEEIQVFRMKEEVEIVEEAIAFESTERDSDKLEKGKSKVAQEGVEGLKEIEIKKVYKNEELISEEIIGEEVVKEPVSKIVENGTKEPAPVVKKKPQPDKKTSQKTASRGGSRSGKVITMEASAYDLSYASCGKHPGDPYYGITASGMKAGPGKVAVDPRVIPLGTKLYIESLDGWPDYGNAIAADTGGAIKGNKIDLFFHSSSTVRQFGRRKVRVHILN